MSGTRCGQPTKSGAPCQRYLDAFGTCGTHGRPDGTPKPPPGDGPPGVRASIDSNHADTAERLDRAAELLASGYTSGQVAAELGVQPQTVRLWMSKYPTLKQTVNALRAEGMSVAYSRYAARAATYADVIDLATRGEVPLAHARAAEIATKLMFGLRDVDVVTRLEELERRADEGGL